MSVERALFLYRIMAYTVGVGLIILVFVGMPLQFWAHYDGVVQVVGFVHGIAYMVYLVTVLNLLIRARLQLWTFVAMVACGLVPFLAFVVEHWVTRRLTDPVKVTRI
jgi:integral membrane protein